MIWLIGCKGMLGSEIADHLEKENMPFIGTGKEVDITSFNALCTFKKTHPIKWIINCSAYTAVDKAEDDKENAFLLNAEGPANIARIAEETGAALIHISTDYVFNGKSLIPYTENIPVNPVSVYGQTKVKGEQVVLNSKIPVWILRTAWLYGRYGNNFVYTMLRLMNEKKCVKIVNDQYGSPTFTRDLAKVIVLIIQKNEKNFSSASSGIYHFTDMGKTTWYKFACEIYRLGKEIGLIQNNCDIHACTTKEYPARVQRPAYSVLDKNKIMNYRNISIPQWDRSLMEFLSELENIYPQKKYADK